MWKWIVEQLEAGSTRSVDGLKRDWVYANKADWLSDHGYCHFCAYATDGCSDCPGKLVEIGFHCIGTTYAHDVFPRLFYAELKRLNKIRLAKK
jgi:hypothetical protein